MPITGAHVLLYTSEADAVRGLLRDVFGWRHVAWPSPAERPGTRG